MSQTTLDSKVAELEVKLARARVDLHQTEVKLSQAKQSGSTAPFIQAYEADVISIQKYRTKLRDELASLIGASTGKLWTIDQYESTSFHFEMIQLTFLCIFSSSNSISIIFRISAPNAAPSSFLNYWNGLSNAVESNLSVGHLFTLPSNSFILGQQRSGSLLFIRPCYRALFNSIQTFFASPKSTGGVVILGNPGIGKSMFICYIMYQLKKQGITMIYEDQLTDSCYLLRPGVDPIEGDRKTFNNDCEI
jgi:hypothetical protein